MEEREQLLGTAETHMTLMNFGEAQAVYKQVTRNYPEDYRGWWGLVRAETQGLTGNFSNCTAQYGRALAVAGDAKAQIQGEWEAARQRGTDKKERKSQVELVRGELERARLELSQASKGAMLTRWQRKRRVQKQVRQLEARLQELEG